jgi:nucleoside-diphosphate-sugar epimerase
MPHAVVTGATGFVGSHLADLLLERGWRVTAALRASSRPRWLEGKAVERVDVDFSRPLALPACDAVFHVAGVIRADRWEDYLAGNRDAAVRAIEGTRASRFVHVSTLAVTGPGEGVDETTPCAPISLYGKSKWEGEQEVWKRRDRVPVTVIRPPVVYGPRDTGLYDMYRTVAAGLRPEIGDRKVVSLVHVRDLVEGILRAAEAREGENEVFLLANREAWTVSDLLDLIQKGLGKRAVRVRVPDRVVRFLGAVVEDGAKLAGKRSMFGRDKALEMTQRAWSCSAEKARSRLGWEARVPVRRGMEETLAWYRTEGLL